MNAFPSSSVPPGGRSEGAKAWRLRRGVAVASVLLAIATGVRAEPVTVVDGYRVDQATFAGYQVWKKQNCGGCHGAEQQGLTGPALIDSLKRLSKEEFVRTVLEGRPAKRMPGFGQLNSVTTHIDDLYAYLKGRSDGLITRPQVEPLP